MEDDTWSFGLSAASRDYQSNSRLKSHFGLFIDFDDVDEDDDSKTAYPCPFCQDDFDLLELCCHIDEDHPIESKSGICPVCAMWVGTNMVGHITSQHGNIFKSQQKLKCRKLETYRSLSFSRKDLEDEPWQYSAAGSSPVVSTSKTTCDSFVSFLYGSLAVDERENVQPTSSSEISIEEIQSDETVLERDVKPALSDKDQLEKAKRSKFVQGLLMSTILDPDF